MIAKNQFIAEISTIIFRIEENKQRYNEESEHLILSEIKTLQDSTGDAYFPSMIEEFIYEPSCKDEHGNEIKSAAELWEYLHNQKLNNNYDKK